MKSLNKDAKTSISYRGFSLVELMIVCAVLCLITGLSSSLVRTSDAHAVRAALDQLSATCLMAQKRAMMSGTVQEVFLELDQGAYRYDRQRTVLPKGVLFGVLPQVKGPPGVPTSLLSMPSTFARHCIRCSPDGIVSPGTVYITDSKKTVLYALSSGVGSVSFLRKYRYAKEWQPL